MTVEDFAPAKVNLTLHVTGRRADGYHLLDSLVAFPPIGDRITVRKARQTSLRVTGPFAGDVPHDADNLVLQAAGLLGLTAEVTLEKTLPAAAGIGGGSADAAATIRALSALYDRPPPAAGELLSLGADVPVCMSDDVQRMRGIGEALDRVGGPLHWPMVLVNPRVPVPTGAVFGRLVATDNAPLDEPLMEPDWNEFPDWLATQRNDLEAPATALAPEVGAVLDALRAEPGCRLARMSGSGATCFAIFEEAGEAAEAAREIADARPGWWVAAT